MVPDVYHILTKRQGVFFNAPASTQDKPKLRLLYECAPIALLVEGAGGRSSDGERSILDVPISDADQRTTICLGSAREVGLFEDMRVAFPSRL